MPGRCADLPGLAVPAAGGARTISDAQVVDAVPAAAWTVDDQVRRSLTAEGLYGRQDDRTSAPHRPAEVSRDAVDRAMRLLGLSGVRRDKGVRTTIRPRTGNGMMTR